MRKLLAAAIIFITAVSAFVVYILFSFPAKYSKEIGKISDIYGIDDSLVFAVVKQESKFKSDAVSRKGARGLMQLMPSTAEYAAEKIGVEYDADKLFDPSYNLDLGCFYLSLLLNKYRGDKIKALAAYNAGEKAVDGWITAKAENCGTEELTTDDIEYKETRNYVKKVLKYANIYEKLHKI